MSPPDGAEAVRRLVDEAEVMKPEPAYVSFGKYRMTGEGLYFDDPGDPPKNPGDPPKKEPPATWLSSPFEVLAHSRDTHGAAWGMLLRWRDG